MSSETVERPEPRADGSYERPMWTGRWWCVSKDGVFQTGYEVVSRNGKLYDADHDGGRPVDHFVSLGARWYPVTVHGLDGAAPSKEPEPTPAEPSLKGNYSAFVNVYFDEYRRRFPSMDYRVLSGSQIQALASDKVFAALAAFRGDGPRECEDVIHELEDAVSDAESRANELATKLHAAQAEVDRLRGAIRRAGFAVMETSGDWSIHDVSELGKAEADRTARVVADNVMLEGRCKDLEAEVDRLTKENERLTKELRERRELESRLSKVEAAVAKMEEER